MLEEQCYNCGRSVVAEGLDGQCPSCSALLMLKRGSRVYRITGVLGRGGFGRVYQALEADLQRPCAIKSIREDPPELTRNVIANEVRLLSDQGHRLNFIPDVYDYWRDDRVHYIAMQFIEGEMLDQRYNQRRWRIPDVVGFLDKLLNQLGALHRTGVVHRDIKPNNIKYNPERGYVLLDFGLAGYAGKTEFRARTPDFAPPEQFYEDRPAHSRTDRRSDLYSLAATAFFLLAGRPPRRALEWLDGTDHRRIVFPPELPEPLRELLDHMLALEPDDRPASAEEALRLLDERRAAILAAADAQERQGGSATGSPGSEIPLILPTTNRDGQFKSSKLDARYGHITDIAVAPGGRELAVASTRGVAYYDLPDGRLRTFTPGKKTSQQLAYIGPADSASLILADEERLLHHEPRPVERKWYSNYEGRWIASAVGSSRLIEVSQSDLVLREVDP